MEILAFAAVLPQFFLFLAKSQLLTASEISPLYNCPKTCGGIEIKYPFGIGAGCFLPGFELRCRNNILYIPGFRPTPVLEIMQGELRADSSPFVAIHCPATITALENVVTIRFSEDMPYTISPTAKFIALGCNTEANIKGFEPGKGNQCYADCDQVNSTIDGTCAGKGCCEISVPPARKNIQYSVKSYRYEDKMRNPCSYAFIADEWKMNFTVDFKPNKFDWNITMKLEWAIGESNCKGAMYSKRYVCGGNSTCVDANRGSGYLCKCLDGYQGNPYLSGSHGCQASVLVFGTTALCSLWCYFAWKKKNHRAMYFQRNGGLLLNQYFNGTPVNETRLFSATELEKATNNYDGKRILGSGGHGTVYKGILNDGTMVAIKKSQEVDQNHVDQFINELLILTRVNHRNIVKLLGCCLETEVPLLVYEFIPNGTLYQRLQEYTKDSHPMPWKDRIRMAKEIAEALFYLHNHETMTIVHRDVKSSNILLDDNHRVKLADFGISRLVSLDKAQVSTAVRGTIGYLDPEYFKTGMLTEKSDVYSYGVVLLELLTSLKPVRHEALRDYSSLVIHFLSYAEESKILGIFEEATLKEVQFEELQALADIARSCLSMIGEERPTMEKVANEFASLKSGTLSVSIPSVKECKDQQIAV